MYKYFIAYMCESNIDGVHGIPGNIVGHCNAVVVRRRKIFDYSDIADIENRIKEDLKEHDKEVKKVVITNFILLETEK